MGDSSNWGLWFGRGRWLRRPLVVRPIDIHAPMLRIELDASQLLADERVLARIESRVRAPDLGRIIELLNRAIGEEEARPNREDAASAVRIQDAHHQRIAALRRDHGVDRLIEMRVHEEPLAPEPVEPAAADVFHGAEEVYGRRMLEGPALHVRQKRVVERGGAEDLMTEKLQPNAWIHVRVEAEESWRYSVGVDLERPVHVRLHRLLDEAALHRRARHLIPFLGVAARLGEGVDEGVEALVLPHVHPLIRADDHGEPHVADL